MPAPFPSTLDSTALAARLRELAGEERNVQADFLLHLAEFDGRRAWAEAGYPSLWAYCLEALHLREGAAGRRIGAMRVLRRFPRLEAALRDGRLCLSTVALLGPVLTEENVYDLVARAAFQTKDGVDRLVASVQARREPREGIRRLPQRAVALTSALVELQDVPPATGTVAPTEASTPGPGFPARPVAAAAPCEPPQVARPAAKGDAQVRALTGDLSSRRVTVDDTFRQDLEALRSLLAHQIPDGDLAAVLHEAIRCAVEKHGRRRGAVDPARKASAGPRAAVDRPACGCPCPDGGATHRTIPASVAREVWRRDGGRCAFVAPDGRRCGSRWKLEFDHVHAAARGGAPTVENLRLVCRAHNLLHADRIYGREHMDRFRRA